MRFTLRNISLFAFASVLVVSGSAWAQGYPTQGSTSAPAAQTQDPSAAPPAQTQGPSAAPQAQTAPQPASTQDDSAPANTKPDKNAPSPATLKDIDAIGNRNVGCDKGIGNWYSLEKQQALGRQFSQQVEHSAKLVADPVVTEYVNRVGQNLVRNSDAKVPFTIKVIDSDEINAFALPGGFFYVNSGLILAADNEPSWRASWRTRSPTLSPRHATRERRAPTISEHVHHSADVRAQRLGASTKRNSLGIEHWRCRSPS